MELGHDKLRRLFDSGDPDQVWPLAAEIVERVRPGHDLAAVKQVYDDMVALFAGDLPGYQKVRTPYHNLAHTLGTFLCSARLLHGAALAGLAPTAEDIDCALIAALFHDSGYALREDEAVEGSGAQFTAIHVDRGVEFMRRRMAHLPEQRLLALECAIRCTDPRQLPARAACECGQPQLAGFIVGTADIVSQMADREYLEKLLFLYYEFLEAGMAHYESVHGLLEGTLDFYQLTRKRVYEDLDGIADWLRLHFLDWLGVDRNLYLESLERNMAYLTEVLRHGEDERLDMLKRGGIVDRARRLVPTH
jgi:hypothetical protein